MGRPERLELIKQIEESRSSKVLIYFCGDRPINPTQLSDDAIRPMYDHLRALGTFPSSTKKLDLILYSLGGVMEVPWKIVTMLREFCDELHVVVPYKAYSGATLIALGADKIWLTDKSELGPIDPALQFNPAQGKVPFLLPDLGVEDIASYVTFLRNRGGLTDQAALSACIGTLAQTVTPPLLGRIERIYSHIRLVARKLLALCKPPLDDNTVTRIVEALTEKTYVHGHGIGRKEAAELGLRVEPLNGADKELLWSLVMDYEQEMKLRSTSDANGYFTDGGPDEYVENDTASAAIESLNLLHLFKGSLRLRRIRRVPPQPVININLNPQLPPGIQVNQLPPAILQALRKLPVDRDSHQENFLAQSSS